MMSVKFLFAITVLTAATLGHAITLPETRAVLESMLQAAVNINGSFSLVVLDSNGLMKAGFRMDGAPANSFDIAWAKARGAVGFGMSTASWGNYTNTGGVAFHIEPLSGSLLFKGGLPIWDGSSLVGSIGVSGSLTPDDDATVAGEGLAEYADTTSEIAFPSELQTFSGDSIDRYSLYQAYQILEQAIDRASALSSEVYPYFSIVLLNAKGGVKAFFAMDNAPIPSRPIALAKALSGTFLPSNVIAQYATLGGPIYGIDFSNGGLSLIAGGLPLTTAGGKVVGSIGVSGSVDPSVDLDVANFSIQGQSFTHDPIVDLSLNKAGSIMQAALDSATRRQKPATIAIVDSAGLLKLLFRMEGASKGTVDLAIRKAYTAAVFGKDTSVVGGATYAAAFAPRYGLEFLNKVSLIAGGKPISNIGGIGVAGNGDPDDDVATAAAGLTGASGTKDLHHMNITQNPVAFGEISLACAKEAAHEALDAADAEDVLAAIHVLDSAGFLKVYAKMDLVGPIVEDIAAKKAKTALLFEKDSDAVGANSGFHQDFYSIQLSNGFLAAFGGGRLLKDSEGNLVGAIGVSGAMSADTDKDIATAGVSIVAQCQDPDFSAASTTFGSVIGVIAFAFFAALL